MATEDKINQTLVEILDPVLAPHMEATTTSFPEPPAPRMADVRELAGLLADDVDERALQVFLERNPSFLLSFIPPAKGHVLALLSQPVVGTRYKADFAILTAGQGGPRIWLFEIERASTVLFNKDLSQRVGLRRAIEQVIECRASIEANKAAFSNDLCDRASKAGPFIKGKTTSFQLWPPEALRYEWKMRNGDLARVRYEIIIGRWAHLTDLERDRLMHMNRQASDYSITTYDQLTRVAYHRADHYFDLDNYDRH